MKIIPTQLIVETCIFECDKDEIHTIVRALYTYRIKCLRDIETEKNKNKKSQLEITLEEIGVLEKALHSYYRIPLVTEKQFGDLEE